MRIPFLLSVLIFSKLCFAEPLRFSISDENQYFYLNPKNSAAFFSKLEIKSFGGFDLSEEHSFKFDMSINYVYLNKQDLKKALVNPNRFGFFGSTSFLDYQLGFWQHSADGTDLNNLFDVVHGKDYRNPFLSENLSAAGLHLSATFDLLNLQFFYIPHNVKSILPDTQSSWWPRTDARPITNSSGTFNLPDNVSYEFRNEREHRAPFANNWGGSSKLNFDKFDMHLMYFSGASQIPQISPHFNIDVTSITPLVGIVRPPIQLDVTWLRAQHAGIGLSTLLGSYIIKTFCKKQKNFSENETETTSCNGAIESSFAVGRNTVRYFLQANRLWKEEDTSQELEALLGFFEKSTAVGFLLEFHPENIFSGIVVYNEKSPSVLTAVRYERKWSDSFRTTLGLNIISAQNEPLAEAYDQNDNGSLKLTYDF